MDEQTQVAVDKQQEDADLKKLCAQWVSRIDKGRDARDIWKDETEKNIVAVYGADWLKDGKRNTIKQSSSTYDFDLLLAFLKNEIPGLILTTPEVFLNARPQAELTEEDAQAQVKMLEARVNQILADMDGLDTEIRCILADAHTAYGIAKVMPKPSIKPHPMAGQPIVDAQGNPTLDPATQQYLTYPSEVLGEPDYDIARVDPMKMLFDEKAKNNQVRVAWFGDEIDRTLEEVKNSGLYPAEVIAKLEDKLREKSGQDKPDWEIDLTLSEVYTQDGKLLTVCEQYKDEFLRYEDTPEAIEKHPYCFLKFTDIPGQWWPKPEISSGRKLQDNQREVRLWMQKQARQSRPILGHKPAVEESERGKLQDGVSDLIQLNSADDVFLVNNDMKTGAATGEYLQLNKSDFNEVMGQPEQDRGLVGTAKFATEAQIAEQKGNLRGDDKLQQVKIFMARIVEKLIFLIKNNPAEPEAIRNIALNLDIDVEIDIEIKSPKNKAIERKQLTEVLTVIAGNPLFMQSPTLLDQILRDYDIREAKKIIAELMQAQQAAAQAAQPAPQAPAPEKIPLSISGKLELLPKEAQDAILDKAFGMDVPMDASTVAPTSPPVSPLGAGTVQPAPPSSAPIGAGTEGMSPGSGELPNTGGLDNGQM